jgi:glycosyltransferase involved in cell wall biosynthesis
MEKQPKFSVVVPTYNRGVILQKTIDSVLGQTFQNFELIIVDDGSTDNTKELVVGIDDARIRYIYQPNGGGSKARNSGIDAAIGKYIAFLDSDDLFLPRHFENALPVLKSGPNICTYTQVIVDRGGGVTFLKPHRALRANEHISDYLMRDRGFVPTITLIAPRELAKKVRYDEKIPSGQDYDFAIRLVCAGAELKMLLDPGASWNDTWNPDRLSSKKRPVPRVEWLERIRPLITDKAYWSEMGWPVAKGFAEQDKMLKALWLYFNAFWRGSYRPKIAIVVFLQIILPKRIYRRMSDALARYGVKP